MGTMCLLLLRGIHYPRKNQENETNNREARLTQSDSSVNTGRIWKPKPGSWGPRKSSSKGFTIASQRSRSHRGYPGPWGSDACIEAEVFECLSLPHCHTMQSLFTIGLLSDTLVKTPDNTSTCSEPGLISFTFKNRKQDNMMTTHTQLSHKITWIFLANLVIYIHTVFHLHVILFLILYLNDMTHYVPFLNMIFFHSKFYLFFNFLQYPRSKPWSCTY